MAQEYAKEIAQEYVEEMPEGEVKEKPRGLKEMARETKIGGPASHRVGQLETDVLSDLLNIKNQLNSMNELLKQIHRKVMRSAA
jgi:hypothetical protein